jgi:hypothetical protein
MVPGSWFLVPGSRFILGAIEGVPMRKKPPAAKLLAPQKSKRRVLTQWSRGRELQDHGQNQKLSLLVTGIREIGQAVKR